MSNIDYYHEYMNTLGIPFDKNLTLELEKEAKQESNRKDS